MDLILANANNDFILANASDDGQGIRLLMMDNKEFDYKEIISFTNNFKHEIVKGGFGRVYRGQMRDGKQVAVEDQMNLGLRYATFTRHLILLYKFTFAVTNCLLIISFFNFLSP